MRVYQTNPLLDPRWAELLQKHPQASVFHTPAWLQTLRSTYGYEPVVYTTCSPGAELSNGLVFCQIHSWVTGRRIVSLPFSDHTEPLVENEDQLRYLIDSLRREASEQKWEYIEIRPIQSCLREDASFERSSTFYLHKIDLRPTAGELFHSFHKNCIQRKIRRAEREGLTYEEGRSESLLKKFFSLLLSTCRRKCLPPQPLDWFRHLTHYFNDSLTIRVASKDGFPVASILTLSFKDCMVFKYGCSDARYSSLGGTQSLLWNAIQESKRRKLREFDLGRSDYHTPGLVKFKDRWGSTKCLMTYLRYPLCLAPRAITDWKIRVAKHVFARLPDHFLNAIGEMFYRHVG